jgi:hypothetical protein
MTETPDLPWWGGTYGVDRTARQRVGGYDAADALIAGQVRESAIAADHTPVGAVVYEWTEHHPDDPEQAVHPEKDWCVAKVQVRPNTVRKDRIAQGLIDGTVTFEVDPSSTG